MWYLANGEELHSANPESFYIPEEWERKGLRVGDSAKLVFRPSDGDGGERMWVSLEEVVGSSGYIGSLINHPVVIDELEYGDLVAFSSEHIIDVSVSELELGE